MVSNKKDKKNIEQYLNICTLWIIYLLAGYEGKGLYIYIVWIYAWILSQDKIRFSTTRVKQSGWIAS